jgi:hypothetical protein
MKCKNCDHTLMKVSNKKGALNSLFNGDIVHKNIGQEWAVICRVKRCGCLKPKVSE